MSDGIHKGKSQLTMKFLFTFSLAYKVILKNHLQQLIMFKNFNMYITTYLFFIHFFYCMAGLNGTKINLLFQSMSTVNYLPKFTRNQKNVSILYNQI